MKGKYSMNVVLNEEHFILEKHLYSILYTSDKMLDIVMEAWGLLVHNLFMQAVV